MIAILDFGSQYSKIIARKIRESSIYCEVFPHTTSLEEIQKLNYKGVILSGGPCSVFDESSPRCDENLFSSQIPVLGICYGMQLMAQTLGGEITKGKSHEYGAANLLIDNNFDLFEGLWLEMAIWMSHGDSVIRMQRDFNG